MNKFVLILILLLTSCKTVEVWEVYKYPMVWEEEIHIPADHWHIYEPVPQCFYMEADTFCWLHYDTLEIKRFVEKRKEPLWKTDLR